LLRWGSKRRPSRIYWRNINRRNRNWRCLSPTDDGWWKVRRIKVSLWGSRRRINPLLVKTRRRFSGCTSWRFARNNRRGLELIYWSRQGNSGLAGHHWRRHVSIRGARQVLESWRKARVNLRWLLKGSHTRQKRGLRRTSLRCTAWHDWRRSVIDRRGAWQCSRWSGRRSRLWLTEIGFRSSKINPRASLPLKFLCQCVGLHYIAIACTSGKASWTRLNIGLSRFRHLHSRVDGKRSRFDENLFRSNIRRGIINRKWWWGLASLQCWSRLCLATDNVERCEVT
jgi:hypothetical protein